MNEDNIEDRQEKISEYWENPDTKSLIDENMRELETAFVKKYLDEGQTILDIGCGAGESTYEYALKVKLCFALEKSLTLFNKAKDNLLVLDNTHVVNGGIFDSKEFPPLDAIITQRMIINLPSWDEQIDAINTIHSMLKPGGLYLAIENTYEGFEELNAVRRNMGLKNIPLHWHNTFLHHDLFMDHIKNLFVVEKVETFNLYYFLTRVFANMFAKFEGYGKDAIKDEIFTSIDKAACILQKEYGNEISFRIEIGESFGPIQGFVLRKIS